MTIDIDTTTVTVAVGDEADFEVEVSPVDVDVRPEPVVIEVSGNETTVTAGEPLRLDVENRPIVVEVSTTGTSGAKGEPGAPGADGLEGGFTSLIACGVIQPDHAVTVVNGLAVMASSLDADTASATLGVSLTAAMPGEPITVRYAGQYQTQSPLGPDGAPLYLGENGELTTDSTTGLVHLRIATVVSGNRIHVRVEPGILHP